MLAICTRSPLRKDKWNLNILSFDAGRFPPSTFHEMPRSIPQGEIVSLFPLCRSFLILRSDSSTCLKSICFGFCLTENSFSSRESKRALPTRRRIEQALFQNALSGRPTRPREAMPLQHQLKSPAAGAHKVQAGRKPRRQTVAPFGYLRQGMLASIQTHQRHLGSRSGVQG